VPEELLEAGSLRMVPRQVNVVLEVLELPEAAFFRTVADPEANLLDFSLRIQPVIRQRDLIEPEPLEPVEVQLLLGLRNRGDSGRLAAHQTMIFGPSSSEAFFLAFTNS
jgi:hypothetical protein